MNKTLAVIQALTAWHVYLYCDGSVVDVEVTHLHSCTFMSLINFVLCQFNCQHFRGTVCDSNCIPFRTVTLLQ